MPLTWELGLGLGPYVLVAGLALSWAVAEIVQTFSSDVRRALKSGWTWLFVFLNVTFAVFVFLFARLALPTSISVWPLALGVGLGWQTLLRTSINLLQPLGMEGGRTVSISLADMYARFQGFCRSQIDRTLVEERMRLLQSAQDLPLEKLEQEVRLYAYASLIHEPERVEQYILRLRERDPNQRSLMLASYLLREGGYDFLKTRLKEVQRRGK